AKNINAISIKRENAQNHDSLIQHNLFASVTSIRTSIISQDDHWHHVVPKDIQQLYVTPHITLNQIFKYLKYQIIDLNKESL
ncbi:nucleotidyltransferase family protein, partial [Staphylococcus aureus]|uniref:nucleotidyltransferase family protein n=1 Tax=Staphylococcus aureus TaxID=1280 RepID=UPI0021B09563